MCAGVDGSVEVSRGFCASAAVENPSTDWSVIVFSVLIVSGSAKSKTG